MYLKYLQRIVEIRMHSFPECAKVIQSELLAIYLYCKVFATLITIPLHKKYVYIGYTSH